MELKVDEKEVVETTEEPNKYLIELRKRQDRVDMWRWAHGDRYAPPIYKDKSGDLIWLNRKQRRALNKRSK